jgi:hypothetical protein
MDVSSADTSSEKDTELTDILFVTLAGRRDIKVHQDRSFLESLPKEIALCGRARSNQTFLQRIFGLPVR